MGDIADHLLDQMCEPDEYGWDLFDNVMYDEETGAWEGPGYKTSKTCNRCGKVDLFWCETNAGWRLFDKNGQHACPRRKKVRK